MYYTCIVNFVHLFAISLSFPITLIAFRAIESVQCNGFVCWKVVLYVCMLRDIKIRSSSLSTNSLFIIIINEQHQIVSSFYFCCVWVCVCMYWMHGLIKNSWRDWHVLTAFIINELKRLWRELTFNEDLLYETVFYLPLNIYIIRYKYRVNSTN